MKKLQIHLAVLVMNLIAVAALLGETVSRRRDRVRGDAGLETIAAAGLAALAVALLYIINVAANGAVTKAMGRVTSYVF